MIMFFQNVIDKNVLALFQNIFILRRSRATNFTVIIKVEVILIKTIVKSAITVNNQNLVENISRTKSVRHMTCIFLDTL